MYRLKKLFVTTKQTLIKDVIREWNNDGMAGRKNGNKVKLTYLCIYLNSCCTGMITRYLIAA